MKRAQIRMSETIGVLFIFFVLILLGIVFYYRFSMIAIEQQREDAVGVRAMNLALQVLFLPELQCGQGIAQREDNCVDVLQLNSTIALFDAQKDGYAFDLFGYSVISITEVYPAHNRTWIIYNKTKTDATYKETTFYVITLRNTSTLDHASYGFGTLQIEAYS